METWCFLGILFSLPHNKADVYLRAASKENFGHPKWPTAAILSKHKVAYRSEMARNEIESDFRTSKMALAAIL